MTVSLQVLRADAPDTLTANCPSRVVLDHVTSKWGVLVLAALADGTLRWGELRRQVDGISEKMLAATLRIFEADGFVHRVATRRSRRAWSTASPTAATSCARRCRRCSRGW